ncbi:hypothetical protein NW249_35325 [Streptomyces sp. OUCMDZ-4982]|uniref:hypothetical protein n=1 Tax=Streptomyces sp. OUCMDZ-4982 TaxID=2973090 RepID=UPI00215C797C|nr:hypothetical protein [Streptomyces sp. OUCMDZ-4982]MCR8947359.1 hypothetical protein [Streptomyces sp. OUCMDZ-4982]
MSTQTIETTSPQPVKPLAWKTGVRAAANATWKVLASSPAEPFFTCQKTWDRTHYVGEAGYLLLAPLLEIAAAYDVPVTKTQTEDGSTHKTVTTYKAVIPVDGTTVTLWATDPDDAATAVEA